MKTIQKIILFYFILFIWKGDERIFAQNLVPNPSFEIFDTCPDDYYQINRATPWFQPNVNWYGAIYFNSCTTNPNIDVPNNILSYQEARTGDAYAGIALLYFYGNANGGRTYMEIQLDTALNEGEVYIVSFYASLSNDSQFATDALGVFFSTDSMLYSDSMYNYVSLEPQVKCISGNIIADTANWVLITSEYTAQGGEKFITIGNFYPDSLANIDTVNLSGNEWTFIYIDDFSITKDTSIGLSALPQEIIQLDIFPNPTTGKCTISSTDKIEAVEIYNVLGEKIFYSDIPQPEIDISKQSAGIYFLSIRIKERIFAYKLLKQ